MIQGRWLLLLYPQEKLLQIHLVDCSACNKGMKLNSGAVGRLNETEMLFWKHCRHLEQWQGSEALFVGLTLLTSAALMKQK